MSDTDVPQGFHLPTRDLSSPAPPDPGPAPQPVRTAVVAVWALMGLGLVGLLVELATTGRDVLGQPIPGQPALSPEVLAGFRVFVVVAVTIGVLLFSVLYVVLAVQLQRGRTWPRTVLIVLAVGSLLGLVITLGGDALVSPPPGTDPVVVSGTETASSVVRGALDLGLSVAAIVLLFRPASRAWLAAWKAVRADAKRREVAW